ncbi:3-oxoadipate enol-lactonase [Paraburkholderia phenazinium]|uniref:3-oxoadipate enol-lactonase n=1 Tax=Paraburkholderia phenazinium TaxID=60549 RepID=A0A1N6JA68_9BURK|nr:3-oxoadipate enol-lactonase [Paraburkholderia phenazinium]SIO41081.1 3-oxoadipate enol-lactonase [Paraburkholderia phenazinium]
MPYAAVNGIELHYRIDGDRHGHAPWIVLSNSLGSDMSMWTPQVAALSKQFRVLRYDTRGHGHSEAPKGPYTIEQLSGDVLGLMDTLKIATANFCGLSMGGLTGVALAARHANRFERVMLCNTAARIGSPEVWVPRAERARKEGMLTLSEAVLPRWFTGEFIARQPLMFSVIRDVFVHTDKEGYASNCEAIDAADLRPEAPGIKLPALVISGTHDLAATPAQGKELAAAIPGARYVELDASHISNIEQAETFTKTILDFLTEQQ